MEFFITGGSGFIGSNLAIRLINDGHKVTVFDNFSTGFRNFLKEILTHKNFTLINGDIKDINIVNQSLTKNIDKIFHLAANADVRFGLNNPKKDFDNNILGTFNILEVMREKKIKFIDFSSTGSVYGEPDIFPTPEEAPFPRQTSIYGASKMSCEGLISAFVEGYDLNANIFRFVSVLGKHYSHGHVFDFLKSLSKDNSKLNVLGDGNQKKSYLHVDDCINAILKVNSLDLKGLNIYNLGTDYFITVKESIEIITKHLKINPFLIFQNNIRGWTGDSPKIHLCTEKILSTGWKPKHSIKKGIIDTCNWLIKNKWIFEKRK